MAEKMVVPLTGTNVTPDNGAEPQPQTSGRPSLHRAKGMGAMLAERGIISGRDVEYERVWEPNKYAPPESGKGEWKHRPVQRKAEPEAPAPPSQPAIPDATQRQLDILTAAVAQQYGIQPQESGPRFPDPEQFDFYDPAQVAEFHKLNLEAVEAVAKQREEAVLTKHQDAIVRAEYQRQFDAAAAEHKAGPNLQRAALELLADNPKLSFAEAFAQANDPSLARPGKRGNVHLPKGMEGFGAMLAHRQAQKRGR